MLKEIIIIILIIISMLPKTIELTPKQSAAIEIVAETQKPVKTAKPTTKKQSAKNAHIKESLTTDKWQDLGTFTIYHYCHCAKCCGKAGGKTASGTYPKAGRTIATDWRVIPKGSKVMIDGKQYIAEDRGGGIKGKKIDVFVGSGAGSHKEALRRGKRKANVMVLK